MEEQLEGHWRRKCEEKMKRIGTYTCKCKVITNMAGDGGLA